MPIVFTQESWSSQHLGNCWQLRQEKGANTIMPPQVPHGSCLLIFGLCCPYQRARQRSLIMHSRWQEPESFGDCHCWPPQMAQVRLNQRAVVPSAESTASKAQASLIHASTWTCFLPASLFPVPLDHDISRPPLLARFS